MVFRPKHWISVENMKINMLQIGFSLKIRLDLYLDLFMSRKIYFNFIFSKNQTFSIACSPHKKDSLVHKSKKKGVLILTVFVTHPVDRNSFYSWWNSKRRHIGTACGAVRSGRWRWFLSIHSFCRKINRKIVIFFFRGIIVTASNYSNIRQIWRF